MRLRHRVHGDEIKADVRGGEGVAVDPSGNNRDHYEPPYFVLASGERVDARVLLETYDVVSSSWGERWVLKEIAPGVHSRRGTRGFGGVLAGMQLVRTGVYFFLGLMTITCALMGLPELIFNGNWGGIICVLILGGVWATLHLAGKAVGRLPTGMLTIRRRGRTASRIHEALLRNETPAVAFALYLRSFVTSGRLTAKNDRGPIPELETCLTDTLEVGWKLPLISIGQPGDRFGSGRIPVNNDDWQALVSLAMTHAQVIFIVPGDTAGTLWEMHQLASPVLRRKTIIVMPPHSKSLDSRSWWSRARKASRSCGYRLPDYDRRGRFMSLRDTGAVKLATEIPADWDVVAELQRSLEPHLGYGTQ